MGCKSISERSHYRKKKLTWVNPIKSYKMGTLLSTVEILWSKPFFYLYICIYIDNCFLSLLYAISIIDYARWQSYLQYMYIYAVYL